MVLFGGLGNSWILVCEDYLRLSWDPRDWRPQLWDSTQPYQGTFNVGQSWTQFKDNHSLKFLKNSYKDNQVILESLLHQLDYPMHSLKSNAKSQHMKPIGTKWYSIGHIDGKEFYTILGNRELIRRARYSSDYSFAVSL